MRQAEAKIIGRVIKDLPVTTYVNLGAGEVVALLASKPWINDELFDPAIERKIEVIHADYKQFEGIDLQIDLTDSKSIAQLIQIPSPKCFFLCNVLEHVPDESRAVILQSINTIMAHKDVLVLSVPQQYPYHADPIDTLYRPKPEDLSKLVPLDWIFLYTLNDGNYWDELKTMPKAKRFRRLFKPFWPFQSLKKYRENISRLRFLYRDYKISIAIGVKESQDL